AVANPKTPLSHLRVATPKAYIDNSATPNSQPQLGAKAPLHMDDSEGGERSPVCSPGFSRPPEPKSICGAALSGAASPVTELERKLTRAWETVFEIRPIGRNENFFGLGG